MLFLVYGRDIYWVVKGFLLCEMIDIVKGMLENFVFMIQRLGICKDLNLSNEKVFYKQICIDFVEKDGMENYQCCKRFLIVFYRFGFILNGGCVYYSWCLQFFFFILMMYDYYMVIKNLIFVQSYLLVMEIEYVFWMIN